MYITNIDEVVPVLRSKLDKYLQKKGFLKPGQEKFNCFLHDEKTASMHFAPGSNDEVAFCFGCNSAANIFTACSKIDGLPDSGPAWMAETIPYLCELLEVPYRPGEPSAHDLERMKYYKLCQDIQDILGTVQNNQEYLKKRNWIGHNLIVGSISEEELTQKLLQRGWSAQVIHQTGLLRGLKLPYFGEDLVTFVIRDHRKRPCGFISRITKDNENLPKYMNSSDSPIFSKGKILMGLDTSLAAAKKEGLIIVEGPGDLAQLQRLGIQNAAAVCGTALTPDHLSLVRSLGVKTIYLCLDWDNAGHNAIQKILKSPQFKVQGLRITVVEAPKPWVKDVDALLVGESTAAKFNELLRLEAFEWMLVHRSEHHSAEQVCADMVPLIAVEPSAVRRELMCFKLSEHTGISADSIGVDVSSVRNNKMEERHERIHAAIEKYQRQATENPDDIPALMAGHEQEVVEIEKEYRKDYLGVNYQLSRYDAMQEKKEIQLASGSATEYTMKYYRNFANALAGGISVVDGALIYFGGRANSGKTASCQAIGLDVCLSDEDTIVVLQTIDDNYTQTEPRLKTTISRMLNPQLDYMDTLSIGMAANPHKNCLTKSQWGLYEESTDQLRALLSDERLVVLDADDGPTLSVLEKHLRFLRNRYPSKKILVVGDNTHRYRDFLNMEQHLRMTRISDTQKYLASKYNLGMMATVEYRKQPAGGNSRKQIRIPEDDDIADARALTFNPNMIVHVYNDLHERRENAEYFWTHPDVGEQNKMLPTLRLVITKNKLSDFKDEVVFNLAPRSVTLTPTEKADAERRKESFATAKASGGVETNRDGSIYVTTDYDEEDGEWD